MSKQELAALVQLLSRVALMQAEALWLQALIDRLEKQIEAQEEKANAQNTPNGIEMG